MEIAIQRFVLTILFAGSMLLAGTAVGNETINSDADRTGAGDAEKINADRDDVDSQNEADGSVGGEAGTASCKTLDSNMTEAQMNEWVNAHKGSANNANYKYVYIPPSMLANQELANLARVGLFKALNHTAINAPAIHVGEDVSDGHCAVYAIDVSKLWGNNGVRKWGVIASAQGRRPFSPAPRIAAKAFDANAPAPADQVAYNAVYGNVYNELINAPRNESGLRQRLRMPRQVTAFGAKKEAIVFGPRIFWLRENAQGVKYWASGDNFFGQRGAEIPYNSSQTPRFKGNGSQVTVWNTHASEAWHDMPNGFLAYYIWGNGTQERSKAEKSFVIDPNNKRTRDLINGRSCISCHISGPQAVPSDLQGGSWTDNTVLAQKYAESRTKFQAAMRQIVEKVSTGPKEFNEQVITGAFPKEPVDVLIRRVEGTTF